MNNKKTDIFNLLFSAFLVTAFMICSYFFTGIINDSFADNITMKQLCTAIVFVLFGLMLFYATRVGDGKQKWRFSPSTLIVMVIPALYIIIASVSPGLPYHEQITSRSELLYIAGVVLGYGIPYTFLSGYELNTSESPKKSVSSTDLPEETDVLNDAEVLDDENIKDKTVSDIVETDTEITDKEDTVSISDE